MTLWFDRLWPNPTGWWYNHAVLWRRRCELARYLAVALESELNRRPRLAIVAAGVSPCSPIVGGDWMVGDALEWTPEPVREDWT